LLSVVTDQADLASADAVVYASVVSCD
jgi:hypothetical protein